MIKSKNTNTYHYSGPKYDPQNKNSSILHITSTNNAACKDEY